MTTQRPLEFRVWDRKTNKLYDVASIDMFGAVVTLVEHLKGVEVDFIERPLSGVELVQFTGLLDKNGTKIFEGDILDTHRYGIMEVEWDEYGQWSPFGRDDHAIDGEDCRVVGNIYQNPDLLK